jgi:hypothetical protein
MTNGSNGDLEARVQRAARLMAATADASAAQGERIDALTQSVELLATCIAMPNPGWIVPMPGWTSLSLTSTGSHS